jgi:hypothetical protein
MIGCVSDMAERQRIPRSLLPGASSSRRAVPPARQGKLSQIIRWGVGVRLRKAVGPRNHGEL